MDGSMDGWIDGWMEEWMNGLLNWSYFSHSRKKYYFLNCIIVDAIFSFEVPMVD